MSLYHTETPYRIFLGRERKIPPLLPPPPSYLVGTLKSGKNPSWLVPTGVFSFSLVFSLLPPVPTHMPCSSSTVPSSSSSFSKRPPLSLSSPSSVVRLPPPNTPSLPLLPLFLLFLQLQVGPLGGHFSLQRTGRCILYLNK